MCDILDITTAAIIFKLTKYPQMSPNDDSWPELIGQGQSYIKPPAPQLPQVPEIPARLSKKNFLHMYTLALAIPHYINMLCFVVQQFTESFSAEKG